MAAARLAEAGEQRRQGARRRVEEERKAQGEAEREREAGGREWLPPPRRTFSSFLVS